uniref:Uncharacterized protein n=1 Tax=Biomphalaria glabrata TaxID=6526 RepID=A0A2C9M9B5_BIOGL
MELKYPLILTLFIVSVKSDCESIINFCERDRLNRPGLTCMYVKEGVDCIVNKGCDLKTYDKIKNFTESWTKILKERNCSISLKELMWIKECSDRSQHCFDFIKDDITFLSPYTAEQSINDENFCQ